MIQPKARRLLTFAVLLLVAGCSSSGGSPQWRKVSTPKTTIATTPTTAASSTTVSPSHVVANLGPCPTTYPQLSVLNAGSQGLSKRLVPIAALNVRVCRITLREGLIGSGVLRTLRAAQFEEETNQLPTIAPGTPLPGCPATAQVNFVTFASDTRQVSVAEGGCGYVTNGVLLASPTNKWLNELRHDAHP